MRLWSLPAAKSIPEQGNHCVAVTPCMKCFMVVAAVCASQGAEQQWREQDPFSCIYQMVLELDPDLPRASGNVLDPGNPPQVQLLERSHLYFCPQDKWEEIGYEFEA